MTDEDLKVYTPDTITEQPFPNEDDPVTLEVSQEQAGGEFGNKTIKPQSLPTRRIAYEVLSTALNTKSRRILAEFEFTQSGALQIGAYQNGTSGDIKISPNGIVARDKTGATTFALDGTTGDATFKGTVQAGSIITGYLEIGDADGDLQITGMNGVIEIGDANIIIDGANRRIIINDGTNDRVLIGYQSGGF